MTQRNYRNNPAAEIDLCRECVAYNKSLKFKPVEGCYDGEYKQGELLDLSVFSEEARNEIDDNWGEPVSMERDFSIDEILEMPVIGEVHLNLPLNVPSSDEPCKIGEPKVSADNEQNPNNSDIADNESHDNSSHGLFCVIEKDSDCIDIDDLY